MRFAMEACCVAVGAYLGSMLDVVSRVEGLSMYPLLEPNDRLLHVPWRLHPACWWVAEKVDGKEGQQQQPWTALTGRIVLLQVSNNMTVCKRVLAVSDNPEIRCAWERAHLLQPTSEGIREEDDGGGAAEVRGEANRSAADLLRDDELKQEMKEEFPILPAALSEDGGEGDDDRRAEMEATGMEQEAFGGQRRRSSEWDWCLDKANKEGGGGGGKGAWVWVEGDNSTKSFDSRHVGALPLDCVRSVVVAKIWPRVAIL